MSFFLTEDPQVDELATLDDALPTGLCRGQQIAVAPVAVAPVAMTPVAMTRVGMQV